MDISYDGALRGHGSAISAMDVIENTPMLVSADDEGYVKLWDIRAL